MWLPVCFHMSSAMLLILEHVNGCVCVCVRVTVCFGIISSLCARLFPHRYSFSSRDKSSYSVAVGLDSRETIPLLKLRAAAIFSSGNHSTLIITQSDGSMQLIICSASGKKKKSTLILHACMYPPVITAYVRPRLSKNEIGSKEQFIDTKQHERC